MGVAGFRYAELAQMLRHSVGLEKAHVFENEPKTRIFTQIVAQRRHFQLVLKRLDLGSLMKTGTA
jgi:hypothetical protein